MAPETTVTVEEEVPQFEETLLEEKIPQVLEMPEEVKVLEEISSEGRKQTKVIRKRTMQLL